MASAVLSSVGAGLLTTLNPNTSISKIIGFQALYGFGVGFGLQQPVLVVQTVLSEADVPLGVSIISLAQMLAGTIFVASAQTIFQTHLATNVDTIVPNINPQTLFAAGATNLSSIFTAQQLSDIIPVYSAAITKTFYIILALSCLSMVGALGTEWKSMKKAKADLPRLHRTSAILYRLGRRPACLMI